MDSDGFGWIRISSDGLRLVPINSDREGVTAQARKCRGKCTQPLGRSRHKRG